MRIIKKRTLALITALCLLVSTVALIAANMEATLAAPDAKMQKAEIVFLIDTTGSMGDKIDNVKNNLNVFMDFLFERSVDAKVAFIEFRDITDDGLASTRLCRSPSGMARPPGWIMRRNLSSRQTTRRRLRLHRIPSSSTPMAAAFLLRALP